MIEVNRSGYNLPAFARLMRRPSFSYVLTTDYFLLTLCSMLYALCYSFLVPTNEQLTSVACSRRAFRGERHEIPSRRDGGAVGQRRREALPTAT